MVEEQRLDKLKELEKAGVNAYPYSFKRSHYSQEVVNDFKKLEGKKASVCGRVLKIRSFGKLVFATILDDRGKIQVMGQQGVLPDSQLDLFGKADDGDFIGATGKVVKSKTGEVTVSATEFEMLAKSLRRLPEKWHGLQDTEARYRQRYLDLTVNPEIKPIFIAKAKMIRAMRAFLDENDFIEVDTPVLQSVYGGAAAKPFETYHNALKEKLFLRIADELYLKRLVIGGMERVYEFGKDFRNEDIDTNHNPEFTMLEFYAAYWDYEDVMKFAEKLIHEAVKAVHEKTKIEYDGKPLDFKAPFKRLSLTVEIKKETGIDVLTWKDDKQAEKIAKELKLEVKKPTRTSVTDALFDQFVAVKTWDPVFIVDYPEFMCPLTKKKRGNPLLAERFELFIARKECGNAYSELSDPIEQRRKFEDQVKARQHGDDEAQPMDEDFLEAMEHGMPPTGGMGIGIERLTMLLTNQTSIKEVLLFPSLRRKA
ncbi:MAG: lysine--tRNA ligase [Candidatus Micrarchaeota archaeon]